MPDIMRWQIYSKRNKQFGALLCAVCRDYESIALGIRCYTNHVVLLASVSKFNLGVAAAKSPLRSRDAEVLVNVIITSLPSRAPECFTTLDIQVGTKPYKQVQNFILKRLLCQRCTVGRGW